MEKKRQRGCPLVYMEMNEEREMGIEEESA